MKFFKIFLVLNFLFLLISCESNPTAPVIQEKIVTEYDTIYVNAFSDTSLVSDSLLIIKVWDTLLIKYCDMNLEADTIYSKNKATVYKYETDGTVTRRIYNQENSTYFSDLLSEAEMKGALLDGLYTEWTYSTACGRFKALETNYSLGLREGLQTVWSCYEPTGIIYKNLEVYYSGDIKAEEIAYNITGDTLTHRIFE